MVIKVLGNLLIVESVLMLPSLFISLYHRQEDRTAFMICIAIMSVLGWMMSRKSFERKNIRVKEALVIVSLGWVLASFFGALPFVFSGSIPSLVDAFFETVSGFTTTGATIIQDIEILPKGILFWRSFSHWIGGMGILVFTVAILPAIGVAGFQIFKAESPGPIADKIVPRIKDTAKILYTTYIIISLIEFILLKLGGMSLYDSFIHTFGTVGTGGFSTRNASIGAFNSTYIHIVITVFMILSGINFSLYYDLIKGKWRDIVKDQELRLYLGIIGVSVILITININPHFYNNWGLAFRDAFFQVSSIITTTGYSTVDFDQWTTFSKLILFILMFVGGSAGSTGGGMKIIRLLVLIKLIKRETSKILHPRAVIPVKIGSRPVSNDIVVNVASFFAFYIIIFVIGSVIVSLQGIDIESSASAVAATLGNIGPGFGFVGPARTFSEFNTFNKLLLSFFMLLGRLEIFTLFILLSPKTWKNEI